MPHLNNVTALLNTAYGCYILGRTAVNNGFSIVDCEFDSNATGCLLIENMQWGTVSNTWVSSTGGFGIKLVKVLYSGFSAVTSSNSTAGTIHGWHLTGGSKWNNFAACMAQNNSGDGFLIDDGNWGNSFAACAAIDNTGTGFNFDDDEANQPNTIAGCFATANGTDLAFNTKDILLGTRPWSMGLLADEATPSILGLRDFWRTGGTTTITDFDDGLTGQSFTLIAGHSVKISDNTNILLKYSEDFNMQSGDTLTLVQKSDTYWYETARSYNASFEGGTVTTTTELTSANIKDLADTPITLVAAKGADTVIEFVTALLIYDNGGTGYAEPSSPDNLVIEYATGQDVSAAIVTSGFLTETTDEIRLIPRDLTVLPITTDLVALKNSALRLFNTGTDLTTGNGAMTVKTTFRVLRLGL